MDVDIASIRNGIAFNMEDVVIVVVNPEGGRLVEQMG